MSWRDDANAPMHRVIRSIEADHDRGIITTSVYVDGTVVLRSRRRASGWDAKTPPRQDFHVSVVTGQGNLPLWLVQSELYAELYTHPGSAEALDAVCRALLENARELKSGSGRGKR